jgi:hypothetical protein
MDDRDEMKIESLMRGYRLKRPPEKLMENYVDEVRRKIAAAPAGPAFGLPALILVAAVAAALAFWFYEASLPVVRPVPAKTVTAEGAGSTVHREAGDTETAFEEMADEWLILQMLGEDQGILDAYDPLEIDMEFLAQA